MDVRAWLSDECKTYFIVYINSLDIIFLLFFELCVAELTIGQPALQLAGFISIRHEKTSSRPAKPNQTNSSQFPTGPGDS